MKRGNWPDALNNQNGEGICSTRTMTIGGAKAIVRTYRHTAMEHFGGHLGGGFCPPITSQAAPRYKFISILLACADDLVKSCPEVTQDLRSYESERHASVSAATLSTSKWLAANIQSMLSKLDQMYSIVGCMIPVVPSKCIGLQVFFSPSCESHA